MGRGKGRRGRRRGRKKDEKKRKKKEKKFGVWGVGINYRSKVNIVYGRESAVI